MCNITECSTSLHCTCNGGIWGSSGMSYNRCIVKFCSWLFIDTVGCEEITDGAVTFFMLSAKTSVQCACTITTSFWGYIVYFVYVVSYWCDDNYIVVNSVYTHLIWETIHIYSLARVDFITF